MAKPKTPVVPGYICLPGDNCHEVILGLNQEEYQDLPALLLHDQEQTILTRWELSPEDLESIVKNRCFWMWNYSFGKPFQPVLFTFEPPEIADHPQGFVKDEN